MPLKTPRSALSNVNCPSSGVAPGSTRVHGPNVPEALIWPGRYRVGEQRLERHLARETDLPHHQPLHVPDASGLVRFPPQNGQLGVGRIEFLDDDVVSVTGQYLRRRGGPGGMVLCGRLIVIVGRNVDGEAIEPHPARRDDATARPDPRRR